MRKSIIAMLLAALVAAGCTSAQTAAIDVGVQKAQTAKDNEARLLKATVCAMSIGAYHRLNDDQERAALDILCGGDRTDALRDLLLRTD